MIVVCDTSAIKRSDLTLRCRYIGLETEIYQIDKNRYFGFTYQQVYSWVRKYHAAGLDRLTGAYRAKGSKRVPENKKLKTDGLELEMELGLYRKIHQHRHHGGETPDFSGVRYMMEY